MEKKEEKPAKEKKKRTKIKDKIPERKKLDEGQVVRSANGNYKIESVLGSGGFGDVYKVFPVHNPDKYFAMKTEYNDKKKRKLLNRLKVEMAVFEDIKKCASPIDKSHFVRMIDKGKTDQFKFIVMEIVSYSLIDIRNNMMNEFTSISTIIQIGRQTMQSIEALHIVGYVHRDIKPHNFAIGRPPNENKIYMLDFGIARKCFDEKRRVRVPRKVVKFLGTVKYAARACHNDKEQGRRDDIEVWCYMMLEYFNKDNLRWRRLTDRKAIVFSKDELMTKYNKIEPKLLVPEHFLRIFEIIERLTYTCTPDYAAIHKVLDDIVKDGNIDEYAQLDWIGKEMNPAKKKKTKADEKLLNEDDTHDRQRYEAREKKRREGAEKKQKIEDDLVNLYKELDDSKTPEQIRAEIRNKLKKGRDDERRKRRAQREEDEEDEEDSEDDYSDETYEPQRRSKMSSVVKSLKDEPSRQKKYDSRKKRTGRRSREDVDDDYDRRDKPSGNRKKGSRNTQSSYGGGGSRMDKVESMKKKRQQSRMDKPAESPPKSLSVKMRSVNDYIVFGTANDMEKAADAKDKEAAEKRAKEKMSQMNGLEITGKVTDSHDRKDGSDQKINK